VAGDNRLWGLTRDGTIYHRHLHYLQRKEVLDDLDVDDAENMKRVYEDWEVI
jgi:hypothetical protein